MSKFSEFNKMVNEKLSFLHTNKHVSSVLILILAIYAIHAKPQLPSYLESALHNNIVRAIMITLGLYYFNNDLVMSASVAVVFLAVMYLMNKPKEEKKNN